MTKSSKEKTDEDTKLILEELKKNSNKSINEIAKKLAFSRQKVWRIVKKLEKDKIIWGYGAVFDKEKLGIKYYILLLKRNAKPIPSSAIEDITLREIDNKIKKMNCEMINSLYTNGYYDWVIFFTASNTIQAKKVSEIYISKYGELLDDIQLLETIFPVKVEGKINPNINKLNKIFS